ncbi:MULTISPECIES: hypothetical protein [unclassified Pseudomonas]|uniref:hypothetical protein n=1 Tax=unclassified Pseudomonas TaxID=196821 RepID=UPI0015A377D9|nr:MULTISPECIES: hypothetical protein [unclassified Pseudomonas]NWC92449.1 hypothetical protein [Pseudomonas sp. IPO3779]NWD15823.1 hypothetical protein [Pseudomonas sp. IPO3778]
MQKNLTHWLTTGKLRAQPIPENASIEPFVGAYRTAVGDPQVQAWFKSKHLNLSTVRVYSDRVEGVVVRDGQEVQAQFSTTDGSGWWEVSAKVRATQKMLSPSDIGILLPDASTGSFNHVDTILDFYGVVIPNDPTASKVLGEQLKTSGWPVISDDKRIQWAQQLAQCSQRNTDREGRSGLAVQLKTLLNGKREGDDLKLSEQTAVVSPESTLAQKSQVPRQRFLEFLASPPFKAFIEKTGFGGANQGFRISEGTLQLRDSANQWISLKRFFDDEVSKVSAGGNAQERAAVDRLNADLNQLVDMSNHTGKALYSTFTYDVRQVLEFNCLGSPVTVAQTRDAVDWLNSQLPPPPTAGDYAGLSPYTWTAGALSPGNYPVLKAMSNGPGSVSERLARYAVVAQAKAGGAAEPDLTLHTFFDSPDALAKAEQMARALELAEVADGRPLSRAMRHQLLSTALKLSVDPDLPGKPGLVAGYDIYQPNNLGRTLDEVRSDIEKHLERKGVSASSAPLVAHLFLAQAAPEFLIRPDPTVSLQAPKELRLSPGQVTVGSTAWLDMRLGCAMAEKLAGAGSSRAMNYTQILNLTRLNATTLEQEELIKDLGAKPLLDWAIMAGIFPKTRDGRYSPGDYEAASKAFAAREEATRQAFATLSQWPGPAPVYVPNSFSSTKTGQIAEAILNSTFDGRREQLLEYANEPTKMEQRSSFPFDSGKVFTIDNLRTVLSLTPFVGSVVNIADGNIGEGLKGLLIDFTSFAATGGLVTAKAFYKGIKAVVPLGNRAFSMTALKGSGPFLRSLFNPLDGTLNVLKSGASALRFSKTMLSGNWVSVGEGLFMAATAFEKCRWGMGVYDQLAANAATQAANRYPGSRAGTSQNSPVYAVQKGSKWYAIDPATRQPAGAPLEDFKADSALE